MRDLPSCFWCEQRGSYGTADIFADGSLFFFLEIAILVNPNKNIEQSIVLQFYFHFRHWFSFLIRTVKKPFLRAKVQINQE